jgi:hypothetical protein
MLATVLWTVALLVDSGPLAPGNTLLIGIGLISITFVGVIGILLVGGHWAHRTVLIAMGGTLAIAVIREIDPWWIVGLATSVSSFTLLFLPVTTQHLRKLPPATGPPFRALMLPLILLGTPYVLGLTSWSDSVWAGVVVGLTAPMTALWYSRVLPGGLIGVRFAWPVLAMALATPQGFPVGVVSAALGLAVAVLAWHPSVKVAFHPPRESGSAYAIPPELAPREILDAARLDDSGRAR